MAEISEEKRKLMNELYYSVIEFRRCQLDFFDRVSSVTIERLEEEGKRLDTILARINGGRLPYFHESSVSAVLATASMLAGTGREFHHD